MATSVPGALNTEPCDPFNYSYSSIPFVDYNRREMEASYTTKLALTLTCRKWNLIATPLLYEVIIMPNDRLLRSLYKALMKFHARQDTPENEADRQHGPGWWTRRFELHKFSATCGQSLCGVLRSFPHLEIMCVTGGHQLFFHEAMDSLPKSLRKLHFDSVTTSQRAMKTLLARCSLLRSVVFVEADTPINSGTLTQAPALRLMSFGYNDSPPETIVANPQMQQLYISPITPRNGLHFAQACTVFLKVQGAYLNTVYLDVPDTGIRGLRGDGAEVNICVQQLAEHCPNLAHLVIIIPKIWHMPLLSSLPASVTHLGVFCVVGEARSSYWSSFFYFLSVLSDNLAISLRVVRLLNQRNAEDIRRCAERGEDVGQEYLKRCRFRVEDWRGEELLPASEYSDW
ncbi:hypothetical protein DENSPDRAFT_844842 [Dentipellis sp. KUC8613]|nr:hypothetical protein DENSPDRAFT_844842 [Dentipellis sp. KUC8613]